MMGVDSDYLFPKRPGDCRVSTENIRSIVGLLPNRVATRLGRFALYPQPAHDACQKRETI